MDSCLQSVDEVVEEIMKIHKSLPARPGIDEVEAAAALIRNVEKEDQATLEAIARQKKGADVPEELFMVLQEMQKNMVYFRSKDQKREALKLLDLENVHALFDEFIQRASNCLPSSPSSNNKSSLSSASVPAVKTTKTTSTATVTTGYNKSTAASLYYSEKEPTSELFTRDDSYLKKTKSSFYSDGVSIGTVKSPAPQILDSTLKSGAVSG